MMEYELSYGIGTMIGSELKITAARKKAMSILDRYKDLEYIQIYSKKYEYQIMVHSPIAKQMGGKKLVGVVKRAWGKPGYVWYNANDDPRTRQYIYKAQTYRIAKDGSIKKV